MAAGRPSESLTYNIAKRKIMLEKFDELQAQGVSQREASKMLGYTYTTLKNWMRERSMEEQREIEAKRMTLAGGSFSSALERLRAGQMVRRRDARWFVELIDGKICLYALDGAGNRRYSRVASFGSPDVLAMDWEIYQP
jgi:hypothetical protein